MDVTGMYLVIFFPLCYNIVHIYFDRHCPNHLLLFQQSANKHRMNRAVIVMMVVYSLCAGLFFMSTYIPVDPGLFVMPLVAGILITTLLVRRNSGKHQGILHMKLFVAAVVMLGLGYSSWLLDRHRLVCYPDSAFQLHAIWHVATAVALVCLYLYQRSENHFSILSVFSLQSSHNDDIVLQLQCEDLFDDDDEIGVLHY